VLGCSRVDFLTTSNCISINYSNSSSVSFSTSIFSVSVISVTSIFSNLFLLLHTYFYIFLFSIFTATRQRKGVAKYLSHLLRYY
jgi:hypothetical protein